MEGFHEKLQKIGTIFKKDMPQKVTGPNKEKVANGFIEEELQKLVYFDEKGDFHTRDKEFIIFDSLLFDLVILEKKYPEAYKKFVEILRVCTFDQYYGFRLEVHIAAILTDHSEKFAVSESPDFNIHAPYNCFIECTSRHLTTSKTQENILKSISNCLVEKSKKAYSNSSTALFIDITNLMSEDWKIFETGNQKSLDLMESYLENSQFGNLTLFSWVLEFDSPEFDYSKINYQNHYLRFDHSNCDPGLKNFLDNKFPMGSKKITAFHFPKYG